MRALLRWLADFFTSGQYLDEEDYWKAAMIVPEGVDTSLPIDVESSVTGGRTMVSVTMGGATIMLETDPESAVLLPLLIRGLPTILDRLYPAQEGS